MPIVGRFEELRAEEDQIERFLHQTQIERNRQTVSQGQNTEQKALVN